jgi:hypothetical protein
MKRSYVILLLAILSIFGLVACSPGASDSAAASSAGGSGGSGSQSDQGQAAQTAVAKIDDSYSGALSPMGQLALGTLKLEDGDLAVTEEQATTLLPLWQALQSLNNSDTTAQAELDAVVKQIQGAMTAAQVTTINDMKLTEDDLTTMMENGDLGFRGFGGRNDAAEGDNTFAPPEGGFVFGPGGGVGGGGPEGGAGGGPGFGGPGFGGGFGGGQFNENDIATRRARFAENGPGDASEPFLMAAVVRLMQTKTGQAPANPGQLFDTVFGVVADETGLSVEEIQAAMADGQTLSGIITSNGGDVEVVRAALVEAFKALPGADQSDPEQQADRWLNQQSVQQ